MIWKLRRKFILISTLSMLCVFAIIYTLICVFGVTSLNRTMDTLTDAVSSGKWQENDPSQDSSVPPPKDDTVDKDFEKHGIIGSETRFSTRYFTVKFLSDGDIMTDTEQIHSVDASTAVLYAESVKDGKARGWYGDYRYKVWQENGDTNVAFVDGSMNRTQTRTLLFGTAGILVLSVAIVLLLIIFLSKIAVKPTAESYEKQKQFITDANHELKTPLTLILANLDIAESEIGQNEWLDDIRTEGKQMAELVGKMVTLCRMDEEKPPLEKREFSLTDVVRDTVSEFEPLAVEKGKALSADVADGILYTGDEGAIRRLMAILLDNAVKYCDAGGDISVSLSGKKHAVLTVENTFGSVDDTKLENLFDRFYRSDKARTSGSGFGIGLSIARATVEAHKSDISAYRAGPSRIGFKVVFR